MCPINTIKMPVFSIIYIFLFFTRSVLTFQSSSQNFITTQTRNKNTHDSISVLFMSNKNIMANGSSNMPLLTTKYQPSRPNSCTYWVTPNILAGEYPTSKLGTDEVRVRLNQYVEKGITFFIDLTQEGEKDAYESILLEEANKLSSSVSYKRLPVQDFGIPKKYQMKIILDTIDDAIRNNNKVYVHCRGGIGRTGTTVGCFLVRHGYTGIEALEEVNRLFQFSDRSMESSYSPETKAQVNFVTYWNED